MDKNDIANELLQALIPRVEELKDEIRKSHNPQIRELKTTVQRFIDGKNYTDDGFLQISGVVAERIKALTDERDAQLEVANYIQNVLFDMRLQASREELFNVKEVKGQ